MCLEMAPAPDSGMGGCLRHGSAGRAHGVKFDM